MTFEKLSISRILTASLNFGENGKYNFSLENYVKLDCRNKKV